MSWLVKWPAVLSVLSKVAGDRYQGAVQGFAGSFGAVASILGLLVGGVLYGWLGVWVFGLASGSILLVFALAWALVGWRPAQGSAGSLA